MHINNVAMHLQNAATELYAVSNNSGPGHEMTLQEHQDFLRMGNDLVLRWHENGVQKELSLNTVYDFMNGGMADQISSLLNTVSNLEERLEAMEFYGPEGQEEGSNVAA